MNGTMIDEKEMTALDRCDVCGAQAYVRATMEHGELLFCGHHASQHLDKLSKVAVSIQDQRDRIS
ncbi:MAG: DUF7455 domain-containing protein [Ancrocorticia sp.]|uniref:DUF7455 domain-containing protein n=1 Tax=Ancrocorticia sp. TaxID=2593684 RepID=UPI003F91B06D